MWCHELWFSENDEANSCNKVAYHGKAGAMIESISGPRSQETGYTGYDEDRNDLTLNLRCSVVRMESLDKGWGKDGDGVGCGTGKNVTCGPDIVERIGQENLPFCKDSNSCCAGFDFGGDNFLLLIAKERCCLWSTNVGRETCDTNSDGETSFNDEDPG